MVPGTNGHTLLGRKSVALMTCNHLPGDLADMGQPTFCETTYEGIGFGLGIGRLMSPDEKFEVSVDYRTDKFIQEGFRHRLWLKLGYFLRF